ncbi:formylglycine-generating enzyme family protein [Enterococcus sp. LJL98]
MIRIPSGTYEIGTNGLDGFTGDMEGPKVSVTLPEFFIAATPVTNAEFAKFVAATNYVTESETFGWSFVFDYFLQTLDPKYQQTVPHLKWWKGVQGANWRHPEGPGSTITDRLDHPVVHVSRNDAIAYCQWAGLRLPTEAEWEIAAKGGTTFERYPWGEDLLEGGQHHCNIWQGNFPIENTLEDGYANTAPVHTFEPNGYGLYQVIGNVWEWCVNPRGIPLRAFNQTSGTTFWQQFQGKDDEAYAIRGGSFLCHASYCKRYRIAARNGNTGMSASNNMGFRCVREK